MSTTAKTSAIPDTIQWRENNGAEETGQAAWRHSGGTWRLRTTLSNKLTEKVFLIDIEAAFADVNGSAGLTDDTFFHGWPSGSGYGWSPVASGQINYSLKTNDASTADFHVILQDGKEINGSFNLSLSPPDKWTAADEEILNIRKALK